MANPNNQEYESLTQGAGIAPLGPRTIIILRGNDRATFLHNLCTNDVRALSPGQGCEAFFTDVKGRVLAHATLFVAEHEIYLDTVPGQAEKISAHLDRYLIREDVQIEDGSGDFSAWIVAGARVPETLGEFSEGTLPKGLGEHHEMLFSGTHLRVCQVDWAGPPSYLLWARQSESAWISTLEARGITRCSEETWETRRVECGWPCYGQDIDERALPQEIGRDARAISFTKGCYLGQETVARLDALGHVNRILRGVKFTNFNEAPPAGTKFVVSGKEVGQATSVVYSPKLNAYLALSFVRSGADTPGIVLESEHGSAEVVSFPG